MNNVRRFLRAGTPIRGEARSEKAEVFKEERQAESGYKQEASLGEPCAPGVQGRPASYTSRESLPLWQVQQTPGIAPRASVYGTRRRFAGRSGQRSGQLCRNFLRFAPSPTVPEIDIFFHALFAVVCRLRVSLEAGYYSGIAWYSSVVRKNIYENDCAVRCAGLGE